MLWLEANGLRQIEGLEAQTSLRALMLHENAIARIENLEHLVDLTQLNLSDNCIDRIEGLGPLTKLEVRTPLQRTLPALLVLLRGSARICCADYHPLPPIFQ